MDTPTTTKDVARRFYDVVNDWSRDALHEFVPPDVVTHAGAGADRDELTQALDSFIASFPDLHAEIQYLVAEDDLVSAWVRYRGTHKGEFAGVPATGRNVTFAAWDLMRVQDGQIVELTQFCDLFTILNQVGALPTATPA